MPFNSLRPVREKKGMTVAQLAGKTSISIRTLQAYEAGDRSIAADDLRKLSRVLYVSTAELLAPWTPPPEPGVSEPLPRPAAAEPAAPPPTPPSSRPAEAGMDFVRRPAPMARPGAPRPPRPRPAHAPRERSAPRPPGPITAGQIEQIRNFARRMGLDEAAVVDRVGAPLESLNHLTARAAITSLHREMEETGTWKPHVKEGPDQEAEYLERLRTRRIPIEVRLINGEQFEGLIEGCTSYVIQLRDSATGAEVYVRKLAVAYYRTRGAVDDAQ